MHSLPSTSKKRTETSDVPDNKPDAQEKTTRVLITRTNRKKYDFRGCEKTPHHTGPGKGTTSVVPQEPPKRGGFSP